VWTYEPGDRDTKVMFNGVADANNNLYWAECNRSCQLVSATRDGAIRFRVEVGASIQSPIAFAGGKVLVAADCFVEAFDTGGQPQWIFDLRSGLEAACHDPAVSFAELHDGKVLVMVASRFAVTLDQAGIASSWNGPVGASIASDGKGAIFLTAATTHPDGGTSGTTIATDESGTIVWQVPADGDSLLTSGGAVFAGSNELSATDGAPVYALPPWPSHQAYQRFLVAGDGLAVATRYFAGTPCMYSPSCTDTDVFPMGGGLEDGSGFDYAASDVLITSRNTALFVADQSTLVEVDATGTRFTCRLSMGDAAGYPHHPMALLPNRLVIAQPYFSTDGTTIYAFDVPGLDLAAQGWVTPQGNAGRAGRPR
jgi:hypothetical protein